MATHSAADAPGMLPDILSRSSALPVRFARDGDRLVRGRIYVAPPDFHLVVTSRGLALAHGPRENGFRPAIDPLFRTAARQLGARVVGVVLSGALSDGTFGLSVVKHCGGVAIVQDPDDALISAMPLNALKAVAVDYVLPAREIGETIVRLSRAAKDARRRGGGRMARPKAAEPQRPSEQTDVSEMTAMFGAPSGLTCPDCGGALWEVQEGRVARYQCHVGHQYAPDNLGARQRDVLDQALWGAVRVLEEQAELKTRMARGAGERKLTVAAKAFAAGADDARELARNLRSVLFDPGMSLDRRASRGRTHARRRNAAK